MSTSENKMQLYFYTESSFIVAGDTKHHKDDLKALGGKFTTNLKNFKGACWMFSIQRLSSVKNYLKTGVVTKQEIVYVPSVCLLKQWNPDEESQDEEDQDVASE